MPYRWFQTDDFFLPESIRLRLIPLENETSFSREISQTVLRALIRSRLLSDGSPLLFKAFASGLLLPVLIDDGAAELHYADTTDCFPK
jgi:hypothetical protein